MKFSVGLYYYFYNMNLFLVGDQVFYNSFSDLSFSQISDNLDFEEIGKPKHKMSNVLSLFLLMMATFRNLESYRLTMIEIFTVL